MPKETQGELKPLEEREIRGLTIESFIKYGGIIVSIIIAATMLKASIDNNTAAIDKISKKVEILEVKQTTDEIWKARIEEWKARVEDWFKK